MAYFDVSDYVAHIVRQQILLLLFVSALVHLRRMLGSVRIDIDIEFTFSGPNESS